jgi:hypothetical protein
MWKFISDLRQVGGFLRVLWFRPVDLKLMLNTKWEIVQLCQQNKIDRDNDDVRFVLDQHA